MAWLFLSSPPQSPLAITPVETKSTAQMVRSEREKTASLHKLRMLQGLPLPWEGDTLFHWTLATALRAEADVPAIRSMECGVNSTPPSGSSPQVRAGLTGSRPSCVACIFSYD